MTSNFLEYSGLKGTTRNQYKTHSFSLKKDDRYEVRPANISALDKMKKGETIVGNILLKLKQKSPHTKVDDESAKKTVEKIIGVSGIRINKIKKNSSQKQRSEKAKS